MDVRFVSQALQDAADENGEIWAQVRVNCNATKALRTAEIVNVTNSTTDGGGGVVPYIESSLAIYPVPADTEMGFGTLDSDAAPFVMGLGLYCQDAIAVKEVSVPAGTIYNSGTAMSAGVVTLKGNSTPAGFTTTKRNVAFTVSCTGLDGTTASPAFATFWVKICWRRAKAITRT